VVIIEARFCPEQSYPINRLAGGWIFGEGQVRDPDCDLDYVPNRARSHRVDHVLVNAHGMGGSVSALVLKRFAP